MTSSLCYVTSFPCYATSSPCCATSSPCCATFLIFFHHCLSYGACYGNSCVHRESGVAHRGCGTFASSLCFGTFVSSLCFGTFASSLCFGTFASSLCFGTFVSSLCYGTFVSSLCYGTFVSPLCYGTFVSSPYCVTCAFYPCLQSDVCTLEKTCIQCVTSDMSRERT